ncbi:MAG: Dyp-type peroxidase [Propionibacteriaceae bacterium]|jgi:putative iron-dependent peroxidase|nr:Dyp-type peroxidase [Micropruina sp.]HBX82682.1 peroxidase [Propionibacteriaceae bacterium]HBY24768.1 peroxidase [Propionibacteriaceae bacterium]
MATFVLPQTGVFALGTPIQTFYEFDLAEPRPDAATLLNVVRSLIVGVKTGQGSNVVVGVRPSLLATILPAQCPSGVHDFDADVVGDDGFTMPATQHDLVVWVQSGRLDAAFDEGRRVLGLVAPIATLKHENRGWNYHGNIDLTGFVDGTENPAIVPAAEICLVPDEPGRGASILLLQAWRHDMAAWEAAGDKVQSEAIGRDKATDDELFPKPANAHNARTDQDEVGKILRKNVPIGGATDPGTLFIGLCAKQSTLHTMLQRMAGMNGEPRDALTYYTTATTGAYYVLPALTDL